MISVIPSMVNRTKFNLHGDEGTQVRGRADSFHHVFEIGKSLIACMISCKKRAYM